MLAHNKAFFDAIAARHGTQPGHAAVFSRVKAAVAVAAATAAALIPLSDASTRLLDYACGGGSVSRLLLPHVAQIVGVDISAGMVAAFNEAASNQGLARDEMFAVRGNLLDPASEPDLEGPEFRDFDVAICCFAYHHIPQPGPLTLKIAERLKPGGRFALVDFETHEDVGKEWHHVVAHNGFSREQVEAWFAAAGLGKPQWVEVGTGTSVVGVDEEKEDVKIARGVFMAVGTKE
ncbi:S-adenosyl-L-methionine-dependent methyltransferase [Sphaerosporella brunnea]|uniref:S-adenosyl-L-methionine-dependent methyltransferase n=1 Tax=Sphaerosporella brunnea TaxID=1250544 RepID=A0A5J5EQP2_9PEZI|nr:S-adenosyl-L-methionine-dependent methyltransferase [Sphaerosporella brunnea]